MTLVTAWVRKIGKTQELVVASDSRVTGGILVNHCPKLFPLERNDSVIAYRLLVRLVNTISRKRDVKRLSENIQQIINDGGQFDDIKPYLQAPVYK